MPEKYSAQFLTLFKTLKSVDWSKSASAKKLLTVALIDYRGIPDTTDEIMAKCQQDTTVRTGKLLTQKVVKQKKQKSLKQEEDEDGTVTSRKKVVIGIKPVETKKVQKKTTSGKKQARV